MRVVISCIVLFKRVNGEGTVASLHVLADSSGLCRNFL